MRPAPLQVRMLPYTAEILGLSMQIPRLGSLPPPAVPVEVVSPICGSRLTLFSRVEGGRIADFAWGIEACALGQASAALIGARALGETESFFKTLADVLETYLKSDSGLDPAWSWLAPLAAARSVPQRHGSVLLPVRAFQRALSSSAGSK
jgi:NifU-like protein involved in Fe-S cluster formation